MLQRTNGRILLALLVITGMAGTTKSTTLSQEERKFCVTSLKKSKNELVSSLKELSSAQLNFRPAKDKQSISEHIFLIASAEKALGEQLQLAMKQPSRPDDRLFIDHSDRDFLKIRPIVDYQVPAGAAKAGDKWSSAQEAFDAFVSTRSDQVKYVRTTTEDLRNHVVRMNFGYIDCYQLLLFIHQYSDKQLQQIREIMTDKQFPGS